MNPGDSPDLARSWIEFTKAIRGTSRYEELFWSWEKLSDLVNDRPEAAWESILEILRIDQSAEVTDVLSAGPLENLLAKHGASFISRVEDEASRNPSFCQLLRGLWKNAITDEIWQRIQICIS
jgi:hypothetical protein